MALTRPLLSVLVPTRNRAQYLKFAIQSALNVSSPDIEIIVSENFGSDDGWNIANSFSDSRLKVVRPDKPLPMHENWEFLLNMASGEWITFVGDDDAVMPHCVDYLSYLNSRYPCAEAIVSPRAYYFWERAYCSSDQPLCFFSFKHSEVWQDSKTALALCLNDQKEYIYLPQIYSGGFHRRSLVQRIIRLQGGHYFRSVSPDAYSAVVASLHTYRYLEVGVPMVWVGTSPVSKDSSSTKDRISDFFGMHSESFAMHKSLGSNYMNWPFLIHFYEAYLAAAPFIELGQLSWSHIRRVYRLAAKRLILRGDVQASIDLALSLGVEPLDPKLALASDWISQRITNRLRRLPSRIYSSISTRLGLKSRQSAERLPEFCYSHKSFGDECPNILSTDPVLKELFKRFSSQYLLPGHEQVE